MKVTGTWRCFHWMFYKAFILTRAPWRCFLLNEIRKRAFSDRFFFFFTFWWSRREIIDFTWSAGSITLSRKKKAFILIMHCENVVPAFFLHTHVYIYIYIYIYTHNYRYRQICKHTNTTTDIYSKILIDINIYIYVEREREREWERQTDRVKERVS